MLFHGLCHKFTRARPTSDMMFSAAAIAVVSEVNPDQPGASLFLPHSQIENSQPFFHKIICSLALLTGLASTAFAQAASPIKTAMNSAVYNNTLIEVTPMVFHRIELGMSYEAVVDTVGKSALYCDSGESSCNADNGTVSSKCLQTEFIQPNKAWMCHWDGTRAHRNSNARLDVWFLGVRVSHVAATMPNGSIYRRDSANNIHLERHEAY